MRRAAMDMVEHRLVRVIAHRGIDLVNEDLG
jgi:hypothetical protein